jgi:hypothetical protein
MNAVLEFDEKEFWIQLFSIVARRGEKTEDEDIERDTAPEREEWCPGQTCPSEVSKTNPGGLNRYVVSSLADVAVGRCGFIHVLRSCDP